MNGGVGIVAKKEPSNIFESIAFWIVETIPDDLQNIIVILGMTFIFTAGLIALFFAIPVIAYYEKVKDETELPKKDTSKVKYTCQICEVNVWGKYGLNIKCNDCGSDFEMND